MADRHAGPCHLGTQPRRCLEDHARAPLGPKREGKYRCPGCQAWNLSLNPGTEGARIIATCHNGCTWPAIRDGMLREQIHYTCIGIDPPRPVVTGMPARACVVTSQTVIDAKKAAAMMKLPVDMNLRLRVMCQQAIWEGDGDLPPVPDMLLPLARKPFVALWKRCGFKGTWAYDLFDQWAAAHE